MEWRGLKRSFKRVLQSVAAGRRRSGRDKIRQGVSASLFVDFRQHLRWFHALPIANHCPAAETLRVSPFRVPEPADTMSDVIHVEFPISTTGLAKPLAFHNELFAATLRIRLVLVMINPLEVRPFPFPCGARFIVWVWLIVAF